MQKQKIDCLFIHAPGDTSDTKAFVMFMAMGVFALADYLQRNGFSSKIIHLGVEKIVNNNFSMEDYLKDKDIRSIGVSLHWHYQSNNSIHLINNIKSIQPTIKIILGGFTASFFADAIMKINKNVDFIVRGEAEIPLLNLMKEMPKSKPDLFSVPNLTWRDNNKIIHNKHNYVANDVHINELNFSNFKLMKNFSVYSKVPLRLSHYSKDLLQKHKTFFLCVGRGCPVNCSFCGGSRLSQQVINRRNKVIFRAPKNVLETIKDAVKAGIDCLYICFDPSPDRKYYRELFKLVRGSKIETSMTFECWSLPTYEFIDEFKKTFGKGKYSKIVISPESASERLRKLNKGFYYTNSELLNILQVLKKKEIFTEIYFSYPLPFENMREVNSTVNFMEIIKMKMGDYCKISVQDFGFDPASPMFVYPAKYKIIKKTNSFSDYCNVKKQRKFLIKDLDRQKYNSTYKEWLEINRAAKLLFLGYDYFSLKNYEEAIKKAKKAIELAPKEIDGYFLLASCYEQTKRNGHALEVYKKALKIFLDKAAIYLRLARVYFSLNNFEEAIKNAKKVIGLDYKEGNIHYLLGFCYQKTKKYKEAITELKKAEKISPEVAHVNFSLSHCYRSIGQIEQANRELEKGILKFKRGR